jgi:hypothetical protein
MDSDVPAIAVVDDEPLEKQDALPDLHLLAIQGFEPCPRCWGAEEDCHACDGAGILGY